MPSKLMEALRIINDYQLPTLGLLIINLGLLIVGFFYTLFARRQWQAIERQAAIASEAAAATLKVVNLECPWVLVIPDNPLYWPHIEGVQNSFAMRVQFTETNMGRSPAFITAILASLKVADYPLPETPDYRETEHLAPFFLSPNGIRPHQVEFVKTLTRADFDSILRREKCLLFYGFVEYDDTIHTDRHVTRFCAYWFYEKGEIRFSPVGPRSYIEYS